MLTFPKSSVSPAERPGGGSGGVSALSPGIWWVSIWAEPDCGLGQLCTAGLGMQSAEHQAVTPDPLAGPVLPSDPVPLGWASRTFPEVFLALLQCLALAVPPRQGTLYLDGDLHESHFSHWVLSDPQPHTWGGPDAVVLWGSCWQVCLVHVMGGQAGHLAPRPLSLSVQETGPQKELMC